MSQLSPELTQAQNADPKTILADQLEQLNAIIPQEIITDHEGFMRPEFQVSDGVSVIFRGRDDLPILPTEAGKVAEVVSPDETPVYSPAEQFEAWEGYIEQGAHPEAPELELIGTATPRGIVDVAIALTKLGVGDPSRAESLALLKQKVEQDNCDQEVLDLFDTIYIAGAVSSESGEMSMIGASSDGPMIAALALAGQEQAESVLETKRTIVQEHDASNHSVGEQKLRDPGAPLGKAELDAIAEAHFVAVHTSRSAPSPVDEDGHLGVFVTGEYEIGKAEHFPRPSIHWSLNHAVGSHMFGDFRGRQYTTVDPLVGLARQNGAPAVLYGVDTYFDQNPGEPLVLSDEARIIHVVEGPNEPIIQQVGNEVRLRGGDLTTEDLKKIGQYLFPETSGEHKGDVDTFRFVSNLVQYSSLKDLSMRDVDRYNNPDRMDLAEIDEVHRFLKPLITAYELIKDELPSEPTPNDFREGVSALFEKFVTGELDIADYPELHNEIVETARILIVNRLIEDMGGQVGVPTSGGQYMEEKEFQDREKSVGRGLGIRLGLHDNQPESTVEKAVIDALSGALTHDTEAEPKVHDWKAYKDSKIWVSLSEVPWSVRRHLVRSGLLNFTPDKYVDTIEDDLV